MREGETNSNRQAVDGTGTDGDDTSAGEGMNYDTTLSRFIWCSVRRKTGKGYEGER